MDLKQIRARFRSTREVAIKALATVMVVALGTVAVQARSPDAATVRPNPVVVVSGLPLQGQEVMGRILQGGPFRYDKDGSVFGNRERLLPGEKRGYYREYTVPTPGVRHRGARRIVCGGFKPRAPEACYYTEDHYSSFRLIVQ
ncbi:ribonuclease domain-containing protein [Hydrogenophaga sp. 2FB]|uniref:ribonuclease domain-containing protein n=1 Tax=Hydrogenophaga sp. 2FB TaxID=2502187 RepID=UPI00207BBC1C|nr:ribonuclease domain-containing protein [Hydrogenophaga sp. 2FB]